MYAALDTQSPGRRAVAIKLELRHTLAASAHAAPCEADMRRIKDRLRGARVQREWDAYKALGAVGAPGAQARARQHGIPLVHAYGRQRGSRGRDGHAAAGGELAGTHV